MAKTKRIITVLVCACLLTSFVGCTHTHTTKHETAGEYVDDAAITTRVKAAIFDELALKTFQINVTTYQGVVQLSGFVDSAENARRAGAIARGVKGVKEVKNDLITK
ncbi:BON domain-containing protein [Geomonas nitrogeniifigens]|uniref:BON domain-containing protein n=1 Tax=Geomonas diazotrophica TaxID=2843197 RepID=UPI001C2C1285|nr:BON domain-containing protein [Geomonas nitrogeniifigens]QXE84990.1 BON domain-containing protein [Geomonas nitrogeniifigens]